MIDLVVEEALRGVWEAQAVAGVRLRGLVASHAGGRVAAVVVTDSQLDDATLSRLGVGLADRLGSRAVELAALDAAEPDGLVRQWVNQAAQGSGRGVRVRLGTDPATGAARVLVSAIDSSARELALRLASPHEPALAALRVLLGEPRLTVVDAEAAPGLPGPPFSARSER